jgi:hypothetical protein
VRELVGVQDRPHRDDEPVGDLERSNPDRALRAGEDQAGVSVDERGAVGEATLVCQAAPA